MASRALTIVACVLALVSAAPVDDTDTNVYENVLASENAAELTRIPISAMRKDIVKDVFIPIDSARDGPVSLEIDLQPGSDSMGIFDYLPWSHLTSASAVDVNVNVEPDIKMDALEVRVNSALTTTTIHIDGSKLFGDGASEYVSLFRYSVSACAQISDFKWK